jgi:flagellar biosynthesis/type III secretory pathway protein FliH
MTTVEQPYQELFDYLAKQLNVIALQTEMEEIEAIVLKNHKQQIKDAYNQGYREGFQDAENYTFSKGDVADYANAQIYYDETFKK